MKGYIIMEKQILDYINCAYLIYNHSDKFVEAHPKAKKHLSDLGFERKDCRNLKFFLTALEAVELGDHDKSASIILAEKSNSNEHTIFCGIVGSNGSIMLVHVQKSKRGAFVILSDVSSEYKYIDRAGAFPRDFIQSQKIEALGNMAQGIAHDLNNVLSIIKGYARMLEWDKDLSNNTKDKVVSIVKAVDRGSRLTNQILDFGSGRQHPKEVLNLKDLIESQRLLLKPLLNKNIELVTHTDDDVKVECSPDHIFQILMNLVVNARDSMDSGGKITVSLCEVEDYDLPFSRHDRQAYGYCCLSVEDQGCGMTDEVKQYIFDSYYTTKERGTGMGMAVIKSISKELNAHIEVLSAPNEGTIVQIFIPSQNRLSTSYPVASVKARETTLKPKTILIVENEDDLRTILSTYFADKGMIVLSAKDGNEALHIETSVEEILIFY